MGRDCSFTTDSITLYCQHYAKHDVSIDKKRENCTYDFQKCAYCHTVLRDWKEVQQHMEEKHEHCRYQCNYCFYRAISPSYVQIHQVFFKKEILSVMIVDVISLFLIHYFYIIFIGDIPFRKPAWHFAR